MIYDENLALLIEEKQKLLDKINKQKEYLGDNPLEIQATCLIIAKLCNEYLQAEKAVDERTALLEEFGNVLRITEL